MPDRELEPATPSETPTHENVQQLIEAEAGLGTQGIHRVWLASNSNKQVLVSDSAGVKISRDDGTNSPTNVINQGTPAGGGLAGTYPNPTLATSTIDGLVPPGVIFPYAAPGEPAGWLFCNGQLASTTTYPRLAAAIGGLYNTGGEPAGTFRVPNLQQRVPLCVGGAHGLATSGGSETTPGPAHTHVGSHSHGLNSHTHTMAGHVHALGAHTHGISHDHTMDHQHLMPHQHTTDINHDHALAAGAAVASGAATGVHEGPSAVVSVSANGHAHDVDLPALGVLSKTSDSYGASPPFSGGTATSTAAGPVSGLSGGVSAGASDTGSANPNTSDGPSPGTTALDASAPGPSYTETIGVMQPFLTVSFIIRAV